MGWTHHDSAKLYNVPNWGEGFFSIGEEGHMEVVPDGVPDGHRVNLTELIGELLERGIEAPMLVRFDGILRARVRALYTAFNDAREEFDYDATYRLIYPIKVNQDRHVLEALLQAGRELKMGLEIGSKPELLAGIAMQAGKDALMICNGYKDAEYVEMALLSSQIGITPVLVIEKLTELDTILSASLRLGIRPVIGLRSKLAFRGTGRWQDSVGDRSKFGLTAREIVHIVEILRAQGMLDCIQLMHFHIGSQITQVRSIKQAMREATNTLVSLHRMGVGIRWFDCGGGLGIDYAGSSTNVESSTNYTPHEYAADIVSHLKEACTDAGIPQPTILTESGRAVTAHHSVLVTQAVGVSRFNDTERVAGGALLEGTQEPNENDPEVVKQLHALSQSVTEENFQECYHDALEAREEAMLLFNTGQLDLVKRAAVETYFWNTYESVLNITRTLDFVPEELSHLERDLADTYFLNFSVFQSVPDAWAIQQLFPIVPLQRLDEEPTRRAVIADLTCDSDGKVDRFIDRRESKPVLEVHSLRSKEPYYMGFFLVGAYQEILGDMHNLFGDTHVVHVDVDENGRAKLTHVVRGDRVKDVLSYVEYEETDLLRSLRQHVEDALRDGRMSFGESALFWRRYEAGLHSYTYLTPSEDIPEPAPERSKSEHPAEHSR